MTAWIVEENPQMADTEVKKRSRDESEEADSVLNSPEVKLLRDDLFDGLDVESELCTTGLDLDSFMKSFENEITAGGGGLTSDSGKSRPELGYLLEASDDALGLPPTSTVDFGADLWGFEAEIAGYDPCGFGLIQTEVFDGEYAVIDGLFDFADMGLGLGDFMWRPGTLPAQ